MKSTSPLSSVFGTKKELRTAGISSSLIEAQTTIPIEPCAPVTNRIRSVASGPLLSTWANPRCHCASRLSGPLPASPVNASSPLPHTTPQFLNGSGNEKLSRGMVVGCRSSRLATTDLLARGANGRGILSPSLAKAGASSL